MCVDGLAVYPQWRPSTFYQLSQITFIVCSWYGKHVFLYIPNVDLRLALSTTCDNQYVAFMIVYDIFSEIYLWSHIISPIETSEEHFPQYVTTNIQDQGSTSNFCSALSSVQHQLCFISATSIWYMGSSFVPSGLQYIWCVGLRNLREWFKSYFRPGNKQTTKQWGELSASLIIEQWPSRLFSIDIHLV